jgi:methionine salvage enolase-phosphatase E1
MKTTHILLDIEGTTCPVSFVSEVLFPYARAGLAEFLEANANDPKHGPKQAFDCFMQVAEYHVPKLARTEHTGSDDKPIRYVVSWKK